MCKEQDDDLGTASSLSTEVSTRHALLLVGLDGALRCFDWPSGTPRWEWRIPTCDALIACRLIRRGAAKADSLPAPSDGLLSPSRWHALIRLGCGGAVGGAAVADVATTQVTWQHLSRELPQQTDDGNADDNDTRMTEGYDEFRACDEAVGEWNEQSRTCDGGPRPWLERVQCLRSSEEATATLALCTGACFSLLRRPDSAFVASHVDAAVGSEVDFRAANEADKTDGLYVRLLWRTHHRHLLQQNVPDVALQLSNTELQIDVTGGGDGGKVRRRMTSTTCGMDSGVHDALARSIICHIDGTVRVAGLAVDACDAQAAGCSATPPCVTQLLCPGGMLAAYLITWSDQDTGDSPHYCALPLRLPPRQPSLLPTSDLGIDCYVMKQANHCHLVVCGAPYGARDAETEQRGGAVAGRHEPQSPPSLPRAAMQRISKLSLPSIDGAPRVALARVERADEEEDEGVALCASSSSASSSSSSSWRKRSRRSVPSSSMPPSACSTPWAVVTPQVASGLEFTSFFDDNFDPLRVLGRGANGAALLVRHRVTGVFYAVKVLLARDYESEREVLREMRLHSLLHSRYLVRYHVCWSEVVTHKRAQQLALIGLCRPHEAHLGGASLVTRDEDADDDYDRSTWGDEATSTDKTSSAMATDWGQLRQARVRHNGIYVINSDEDASVGPATLPPTLQASSVVSTRQPPPLPSMTTRSILGARVIFLQMEFCQMTLKQYLDTRPAIDRMENMIIALQLISALRYMHRLGILHRDLKPTNVFLNFQCQRLPYGTCGSEEDSESSGLDTLSGADDGAERTMNGGGEKARASSHPMHRTRDVGKVAEVGDDVDDGDADDVEAMTSEYADDEPHSADLGYGPLTTAVYFPSRMSSVQTTPRSRGGAAAAAMDEAVEMLLQSSHLDAMTLLRQGGASRIMQRLARQRRQQGEAPSQASPVERRRDETVEERLRAVRERDRTVYATARWLRHHLVQARLGDFGLAKCVPLADTAAASARGRPVGDHYSTVQRRPTNTVGVGTPLYASPEQLRGERCGGASDGFSLGVLFAELYMQVGTQSERLVRLQQVRCGEFLTDELRHIYPELAVVPELTRPQPGDRVRLGRAYKQIWSVLLDVVAAQLKVIPLAVDNT